MSFVAQCVFCKHKVKAPDEALGASVRCKKCDNSFTLAPIEEAPPEQVLTRFRRHAADVVGLAGLAFAWLAMRPALILPAAGAVVSSAVLIVAVFLPEVLGPAFEAARQRPNQDAQRIVAVPLRSATRPADLARPDG